MLLLWLLPGVAAFACILSAIRLGRRQGINCQTEARLVVFVVSVSVAVGSTMEFLLMIKRVYFSVIFLMSLIFFRLLSLCAYENITITELLMSHTANEHTTHTHNKLASRPLLFLLLHSPLFLSRSQWQRTMPLVVVLDFVVAFTHTHLCTLCATLLFCLL